MAEIFKAYDVRGVYPTDINEDIVYQIGRAFVEHIGAQSVAVGRDNRTSSPALFRALAAGITDAGANVIDCGLLSTPMLYFASATLPVDGAIMITASHNPKEYNGLKLCRKNAVPIGLGSGLADIRDHARKGLFAEPAKKGTITFADIKPEYDRLLLSFADFQGKRFHVITDTAHAMGVLELPLYEQLPGIVLAGTLYGTLQEPGVCPHEANPLETHTLIELQYITRRAKADIGIAYDGDADRIGFVDERGHVVPMDLVTALLAQALLPSHPGKTVLYDLRSSRAVPEAIHRAGGKANECKVGHANIKKQMIEENALLAGEASGHYYFSLSGYTAEMGSLPAILLMNLMAKTGKKLSELAAGVKFYAHSGEINLHVENAPEIFTKVKARYADGGKLSELDGVKIDYPDWWFSLRASNTEPLIRLNLEADTPELMEEKREELLVLITEK